LFHFWWLIFPLGGMIGGGVRAVAAANERRAERRLERYRIKQQTKIAVAEAAGRSQTSEIKRRRELRRILDQQGETDARWLEYEIDIAKLLDFPLMTDMRNPLTMEFHKARRRADLLRPENPADLDGDREAQLEYRDAVHDYVSAFDVAEAEAIRLRRSTFSAEDQQRIFGRFERAVSGHHYGGMGLGLWITGQIVEAHGGAITVQSSAGAGARFTVELPL